MLADLSYRLKTPLAMSLVIVATAVVVAAALTWQGYQQARQSFIEHAQTLGKTLARTVRPALLHDDPWQAYETLITPLEHAADTSRVLILLDAQDRIFAASEPRQFGMLESFDQVANEPGLIQRSARQQLVLEGLEQRYLYILTPIVAGDGSLLGRLVQRYDQETLGPRIGDIATGTFFAALAAMLLLLPLGWLAGKHLAEPLSHLAQCLTRVGREIPETIHCQLPKGRDEIGQLAARFTAMVEELRAKRELERHLAQSDRLAAIGRLTAGIAHEINNPLGGMLNAISNHRRRGVPDAATERTLGLIERGLNQIRSTVSALLVEAKVEARALTAEDLEDVRTLVATDAQKKGLRLHWRNQVDGSLPLPSGQVRQILLNLLLNAVAASPEQGEIICQVGRTGDTFRLTVGNAGPAIPERRRLHLFEPYFGEGENHGLGLWVTYQLVQQLHGDIEVESLPGYTRFTVTLPIEDDHGAQAFHPAH